jgi:hypothetical protein
MWPVAVKLCPKLRADRSRMQILAPYLIHPPKSGEHSPQKRKWFDPKKTYAEGLTKTAKVAR